MPPFIIFEGKLCSPDIIFISWEQELLIKINGGHTEAAISLLLLYLLCYVQYPKECVNVHLSLRRYILKVYDSARLPNKFNAISERKKLLRLYFLCFVGEFEIENNKGENKRTPSHSNVFVALELISLLRVLLQHIGCCFITLVEVLIYTN